MYWHYLTTFRYGEGTFRAKMAALGGLMIWLTLFVAVVIGLPESVPTFPNGMGEVWVAFNIVCWAYGLFLLVCAASGKCPWRTSSLFAIPARQNSRHRRYR